MPYKREYHAYLCRFMEFQYGFSVAFDSSRANGRSTTFSRDELLSIRPNDIKRFMAFCAFGDPDYDVNPPANHRPTKCRSSTLEATKRALSFYMPYKLVPWCQNRGNPTRSAMVNDIIKQVKKFEVRAEGAPSKAKRPVRPNEFRKAISLLRSHDESFDLKYRYPMVCLWQHHLIGRLDDAANFEVNDPSSHPDFDFALQTQVRWSKNVMEERDCPPQIVLAASESGLCTVLNLAIYLEEHLRRTPGAKYLFTDDLDDQAPTRLKTNHRNNMDRHVFKNDEFCQMALESDEHKGLGTHSFRKGSADEARKVGAQADEIEIRGRWKPQGKRVVYRYIDVDQLHIDAKVAALLCPGGPIKYKLKVGLDRINDEWLFTNCVPHIRARYPTDRRLCRTLGLATLYAYCEPTLRGLLTEFHWIRIAAALQGLEYGNNCVEKIPLHVYNVNGNLHIEELTQGAGQEAGAAQLPMGVAGTDTGAMVQTIILNQQRTITNQALMQVQIDNRFAEMKTYIGRQNVTLNGNIHRFGGTVQGGFARQDPVQAGERQAALRERGLPLDALNLPAGVLEHRDPTAELAKNLHSLEDYWREWKYGIGGRKPAQLFSSRERGGHGSKRKSMMFSRRLRIYTLLQLLVDEGRTIAQAIEDIKNAYGHALSMTRLSEAIRRVPRHPNIRPVVG